MQGFKNLLPRPLLYDDSLQPILKKTDQQRKTTQTCLQHFLSIYKNIETFSQSFQTHIFQLHHQLTETQNKLPLYFLELSQLFKNINVQVKIFTEKSNCTYRQLTNSCNSLFLQYSNVVLNFQQHIRNYQSMELILFQMSKKYSRTFKNMLGHLDSYKGSFTDARLIYNTQEKVKRYQQCQSTYKGLQDQLKIIQEKCDRLTEKKTAIRDSFLSIQNEMKRTIKVIASKSINEIKNFVKNYSEFQKTIVTFLAQKKFSLEKLNITTIFESISNKNCSEYFNCQVKPEQCKILPAIFVYIEHLKSEYIPYCKTAFLNYFKEANQRVEKRKDVNRQVLEFLKVYSQAIEKHQYVNLKEIVANFQKQKKRFSELFSARFVSFMKSIHSIFELSIGINEKLLKSFNLKLKNIENFLSQENKHMEMFLKELRSNVEKFLGRKQKKLSGTQLPTSRDIATQTARMGDMNKSAIFMQESFVVVDNTEFRKQIKQRAQFLIHLIHGFISKIQSNHKQLKAHINSIVNDYSESTNEFYSLCCEYETIYFGSDEFANNFKKYETDIDKSLQKETSFMKDQLGFKGLIEEDQDQRKIVFDGEMSKVQEFKKLKKPTGLENQSSVSKKAIAESGLQRKESINTSDFIEKQSGQKSPPATLTHSSSLKDSIILSSSKQTSKQLTSTPIAINKSQEKSQKYFQLLSKKVTFIEGEEYIKSFSCAFYDKIILQGRIFITNKRLCFHSKFNPTTIFFGGTFIDIPRKDITKVEKRYNALVFDNSIAITTVNGEMFFTSFFSRDEAFDLINQALDINFEEQFFEPQAQMADEAKEDQISKQVQAVEQEDDLKAGEEIPREEEVNKILQTFPYQLLYQSEFQVPKINAMKFFRLFDSGQEIHLNRRTYKSFLQYCKDLIAHKQIEIHHFKPNILQYLNFNNIKNNTPIKIQRKLNAMVPISAAGVPFMPKAARSDEVQALYFISKNKYIIQSTIQNSGAPYTDSFNIKLKRTVESIQQNKVRFRAQMYVNFMKSTMMKSMIQSKAMEQTKGYFIKMSQQMKKYFKSMQKIKKSSVGLKGQGNGQGKVGEEENNNEQIQQLRKELQIVLQEKQTLTKSIENLKSSQSRLKQYLFVTVILNVFLILLLIN